MDADTFGARIYRFYRCLRAPKAPRGVSVMNPYADRNVARGVRAFLGSYFNDDRPRVLVFGINPGRFGAGITGITFTDPVALADFCGIANNLGARRELSSVFIYDFIARYGGVREFYRRFFLTAASPLGFLRRALNLNYYDVPQLLRAVTPFIVRSIEQQIHAGGRRDRAIVIGKGANLTFLRELNDHHGFFDRLDALEHPRAIMQYRRKRLDEYLDRYVQVFREVEGASAG
jgi:hypothetical protein